MRTQRIVTCLAFVALAFLAVSQAAASDQEFVTEVAGGNMFEVELGKVALKNAAGNDAKEFASKMVTDHGQANAELAQLAAKKNFTMPNALDAKHQAKLAKFSQMTGAAFDQAYIADMKEDHEKDVKEVKETLPKLSDPDLKAWGEKALATMEQHLEHVNHLAKTVR